MGFQYWWLAVQLTLIPRGEIPTFWKSYNSPCLSLWNCISIKWPPVKLTERCIEQTGPSEEQKDSQSYLSSPTSSSMLLLIIYSVNSFPLKKKMAALAEAAACSNRGLWGPNNCWALRTWECMRYWTRKSPGSFQHQDYSEFSLHKAKM